MYAVTTTVRTHDFGAMVPGLGAMAFGRSGFRNRRRLYVYAFAPPIFLEVFDGFIIIGSFLIVVKWSYHIVDTTFV